MTVHYSTTEGVARITIDRPPVNALDDETYRELTDAFETAHGDLSVHAAVLDAAGPRAFCGGTDINFFSLRHLDDPGWHERHSRLVRDTFSAIYRCRVPVVAAAHRVAVGAGVGLLGSCDLVVLAADVTVRISEIDVGVLGGARHLARLLPEQIVRYLAYTGGSVSACEIRALGGAVDVVEDAPVAERALQIARTIAAKNPQGIDALKRGLNHIELNNLNVDEGYRYEQTLTASVASHPNSQEAAQAFFEKRSPVFR